jgi:hypothetical protein
MVLSGICESVGVVIKNSKGEYLAVKRKLKPIGWGFPAAHLIDEKTRIRGAPGDVIRKVVSEEIGITLINIHTIMDGGRVVVIENGCRREFRTHFCYLYGVYSYTGNQKVMKPKKHDRMEFASLHQLQEFEKNEHTDPAWFTYIFPDLKERKLL